MSHLFGSDHHATRPPQPHVYILRDHRTHGGIIRFFFVEELTALLASRNLREVHDIPGVLSGEGVRAYDHYLAVQWSTYVLPEEHEGEDAVETERRIEQTVLGVLVRMFNWDSPLIEDLHSLQELREVAELRGVPWQLGRS